MSRKLGLTMCAPADDDREYFAALTVDTETQSYTWAEIHLEGVDQSEAGPRRVEAARAVVRIWSDDAYFDLPYPDVVAVLDRARTQLLVVESHVPPD